MENGIGSGDVALLVEMGNGGVVEKDEISKFRNSIGFTDVSDELDDSNHSVWFESETVTGDNTMVLSSFDKVEEKVSGVSILGPVMENVIGNDDGAHLGKMENGGIVDKDKINKEVQDSGGSTEASANLDNSNDSALFETGSGDATMVLGTSDGVEEKAEVLARVLFPAKDDKPDASDIPNADVGAENAELLESKEIQVLGRADIDQVSINEAEGLTDNVVAANGEMESNIIADEDSDVKLNILESEGSPVVCRADTDQVFVNEAERLTDNVAVANVEIELEGTTEKNSVAEVNIPKSEGSPILDQPYTEEVSDDEVKGLKYDVKNGDSNLRDVNETRTVIDTKISGDEDVVVDMTDEGPNVHGNDVSCHGLRDIVHDGINADNQEKQVHKLPESQGVNEAGCSDSVLQDHSEYNDVTMYGNPRVKWMDETHGTPCTGKQENRSDNDVAEHGFNNYDVKAEEEKGVGAYLENKIREPGIPVIKENGSQFVRLEYLDNEKNGPSSPIATIYQEEKPTVKDDISSAVAEVVQRPPIDDSSNSLDNSSVQDRAKASETEVSPMIQGSLPRENIPEPEVTLSQKTNKDARDDPSMSEQEANPATNDSSSTVQSATPARSRPHLPTRAAGLGRAAPLLDPVPRAVQHPKVNGAAPPIQNQLVEEPSNGEAGEYDETREKLQMIRVKFLRLANRLGQTPHNVVVAQVLYRLGLAEQLRGRSGSRVAAFSFDRASAMAEQLETAGQEPLDFSCTIMVLGKTGVGKSATINSIFDEVKFGTDAFHSGTKRVQDVVGTVQGIKVRVIDTPGLLSSWSDQRHNAKILRSVKQFIKKTPPDIVLYLDRLDMPSRDSCDMPLLQTITETFGPSIWFNAIVGLTHAASAPPEGPSGTATSYDMFVTQRSHAVQQEIRQAAGDMRLMNPVSLVENHSACRTNRAGQRVLPNGQVWKPHLLLLSFASKILAEANTLLKLQESSPGKPFATRSRAPPLPFLLSSLLQSRPQVKLPTDQVVDEDDSFDDLENDQNSEDEYDQLPPFKSLTKAQLAKLPKDQRKAYYAELEYREKLFMKKQLKEEKFRRKIMREMQAMVKDFPGDYSENAEDESGSAAPVPVPMPDLALPSSFDSDNPTHRYRSLDSNNQWLIRPVLEPNGWDHDVGYEGINLERLFVIKEKVPFSFSGQVSKDKKDANLQMEVATCMKHGEGKATSLGFDLQSVGKDIAYTLRGETQFCNYRRNKATAGTSLTILGDVISGGVKVEDKLIVHKRGQVVVSGGAMFGRGDVAYGGSLEATLRDKDHPLGRFLMTLALSAMDYHGDLALGCNSQIQIPVGRHSNLIGRVNINNRGAGQVSIRLNSSEQLQIALVALLPFAKKLFSYTKPAEFVYY